MSQILSSPVSGWLNISASGAAFAGSRDLSALVAVEFLPSGGQQVYFNFVHNHDGVYSVVSHNHDMSYALLNHSHGSASGLWNYMTYVGNGVSSGRVISHSMGAAPHAIYISSFSGSAAGLVVVGRGLSAADSSSFTLSNISYNNNGTNYWCHLGG